MWAVLTDSAKSGGRWQAEDFYAHGSAEIERLMKRLDELGLAHQRQSALDFGCGVGRLTNALADYFEHVDGVDISAEMVRQAAQMAPNRDRCTFHTNVASDLSIFPDDLFDLVHCNIVLQHVGPQLTRSYIAEFARIVRPGGVVHFQLPVKPAPGPIGFVLQLAPKALLNRLRGMSMHGVSETRVHALLYSRGLQVVATDPDESAGHRWISRRYTAVKPAKGHSA
jgi:ubiquinone/menaquinone biosynthesis C-methylase UbiE